MDDQEFKSFSTGGKWVEESQDDSEFFDFENEKVIDYQYEQYKKHLDEDEYDEDEFDLIH